MSSLATPENQNNLRTFAPEIQYGQIIDERFLIHGSMGKGGQASVYSGNDNQTGADVVMKVPLRNDDEVIGRFVREAEITEALSKESDDVANYVGAGISTDTDRPFIYLATEKLPGGTLYERMRKAPLGRLTVGQTVEIVAGAFSGIATAHEAGIINRDIKPDNIAIAEDESGKAIDWGIAGLESDDPADFSRYDISPYVVTNSLTDDKKALGTANYIPPETWLGENTDHKAADVFSGGVTLHQALTGKRPDWHIGAILSDGSDVSSKTFAEQYQPPSLDEYPPEVPRQLAELAINSLDKNAANRPTMQKLVEELKAAA